MNKNGAKFPSLTYFYPWQKLPLDMFPNVMYEFKDNGVDQLVINDYLLEQIIRDPHYLLTLKRFLHQTSMRFFEVHGLWSTGYDIVCSDKSRIPGLIADHKLAMNYAAELGCRTYVVHIGAYESVFFRTPNAELRPTGVRVLEQLLPEAEKLDLVIAVENSYEISNTPDEVLYYIQQFNNPHIACCMDVGHANIMAPGPGKTYDRYCGELHDAWGDHIVQEPKAFEKLAPYIVTMHLHDNDGFSDGHQLPFTGTIDWSALAAKIATLPRLISLQSEVNCGASSAWSIRKLCETFRSIF